MCFCTKKTVFRGWFPKVSKRQRFWIFLTTLDLFAANKCQCNPRFLVSSYHILNISEVVMYFLTEKGGFLKNYHGENDR